MNRNAILALFVLILSSVSLSFAAFEDIGSGARPVGMGSAFSAVADDANTVSYNPAGLGQLWHPQFTAGYGRLSLGLTDESNLGSGNLAFTVPVRQGNGGTLGGAMNSLQLSGAYKEDVYSLAYGRSLFSSVLGGVSVKYLRRSYGSDAYTAIDPLFKTQGKSADALSLDLGLIYRYSRHYVYSLTIKDFNSPDVGLNDKDRVATAWKGAFAYYQRAFVMSAELTKKESNLNLSAGGERWFMHHKVAARGGFDFGTGNKRNLAVGASARMGNAQVDYAFILPLAGLVDTTAHRLSFTVRFGSADDKPVALLEQEEILGDAYSDADVEGMRQELERVKRESEGYQKETKDIQSRIVEMEGHIKALLQGQSGETLLVPPVPSPKSISYPKEPTPLERRPVRVRTPQSTSQLKEMQKELEALRQELEKRDGQKEPAFVPQSGPYTVQEGDTLQSIAAKTLGDSGKWVEIFQANKDRIKRGGEVTPGQILDIP